jgi:hypothetical protein
MRKFLRLIEDNNPDAAAARYTFTLTMRNETGDVNETLVGEIDDHSAAGDIWAAISDIFHPVEDQDIPIEDNEMLQAQAEAGNPMAAQAIADREEAIQSLAAAYQQETEQIAAAAGDMQSGVVKV